MKLENQNADYQRQCNYNCIHGTIRPESKQGNTTNLNIFFPWKLKIELLRWDTSVNCQLFQGIKKSTKVQTLGAI